MGNIASYDTGDKVSWGHGNTLKKTLPPGVYSQICYEGSERSKLSDTPNERVATLLQTKGLTKLHAEMQAEVNGVKGTMHKTKLLKNMQEVVKRHKPQFEKNGVKLYFVKKYTGQLDRFWFEYVDIENCKEHATYTPKDGLHGVGYECV